MSEERREGKSTYSSLMNFRCEQGVLVMVFVMRKSLVLLTGMSKSLYRNMMVCCNDISMILFCVNTINMPHTTLKSPTNSQSRAPI